MRVGDPAFFISSSRFPSLAPFNLWHQKPDQFLERKKLVWGGGEGSNETSRPIGACKTTSDVMLNAGLKMKNFPQNVERFVWGLRKFPFNQRVDIISEPSC